MTGFTHTDDLTQVGWWGRRGPGSPWRFDRTEDPTKVWAQPEATWVPAYIQTVVVVP